jgi:hypothetical protein
MRKMAAVLSIFGLALSTVPAFAVFYGITSTGTYKQLMLAGMVVWFVAGSYWFRLRKSP